VLGTDAAGTTWKALVDERGSGGWLGTGAAGLDPMPPP
jgi:hypothetical protein